MAVSTVKAEKQWTYLATARGTSAIDISGADFEELFVQVDINGSGNKEVFFIPKLILSATTNWFRMGGYGANNSNALVTIRATSSEIALVHCVLNGTDYVSGTTTQAYYR